MKSNIQILSSNHELVSEIAPSLVELGYRIVDLRVDAPLHPEADLVICDPNETVGEFNRDIPTLYVQELANGSKTRLEEQISHLILPSMASDLSEASIADAPKLNDRVFVRYKEKMVKLNIDQILYVEADRNYCRIFCIEKEYVVSMPLKSMESKLPDHTFFRIHRSYLVNLNHIDEVAETHLVIARKALPVSKTLRSSLLKRLQTI